MIHIKIFTLNKTQSEGLPNEETQQHRDIGNRSINTMNKQIQKQIR